VSLDSDLKLLADQAVADWPEIALSGQLTEAIAKLYRVQLRFPPWWTRDECDDFISRNADMDAGHLATQFDDLIDTVIDRFGRQHGILPHYEDADAMIAAERRAAVYDLEGAIEALSEEVSKMALHSSSRAPASMTGCSTAGRRSRSTARSRRKRR